MSVLRVYGKDFHSIQSQKVGTRWNLLQMSWKTSDQLLKHSTLIICFSLIWSAIDLVVVIELLQSNNLTIAPEKVCWGVGPVLLPLEENRAPRCFRKQF